LDTRIKQRDLWNILMSNPRSYIQREDFVYDYQRAIPLISTSSHISRSTSRISGDSQGYLHSRGEKTWQSLKAKQSIPKYVAFIPSRNILIDGNWHHWILVYVYACACVLLCAHRPMCAVVLVYKHDLTNISTDLSGAS
jgi:hypothetical protein